LLKTWSVPDFRTLAALSVDLVVGANNPHRERLAAVADARGNTRLHPPRPHLAGHMAEADLAIGAGRATAWKRCCLGLPSLVVSIADNQRPACEALAAEQRIAYLGHQDAATTESGCAAPCTSCSTTRGNVDAYRRQARS